MTCDWPSHGHPRRGGWPWGWGRAAASASYGAAGSPPVIPKNATLIFAVELLGIG